MIKHHLLQKNYYKNHANNYDHRSIFYKRKNRNHIKKINLITSHFPRSKNFKVLEVGTGTGIHAEYILQHFPKCKYVGLDLSKDMLDIAKQRLGPSISLISAPAENLPFPDNKFDFIFFSGTLHHVYDQDAAISEAHRVLKQNGEILLMEPNIFFPTNLYAALTQPVEKMMLKMTNSNIDNSLRKNGFKEIEIRNEIFTPPFPEKLYKFWDKLDETCARLPFLSNFSIMIFANGKKRI